MLNDIQEFFSGTHGLVVLVCLGAMAAILHLKFKDLKVREHKWFGDLARALTDLGLSDTYTKAFSDLSAGDIPSAIGAAEHAASAIKIPGALAAEVSNIVAKALADPARKAALLKTAGDIVSGASPEQIKADILAEVQANPLSKVSFGPLAHDVHDFVDRAKVLATKPGLAAILDHLPPGMGKLAGLLQAGHDAGLAEASGAPAPTASNSASNTTTVQTHADNSVSVAPAG